MSPQLPSGGKPSAKTTPFKPGLSLQVPSGRNPSPKTNPFADKLTSQPPKQIKNKNILKFSGQWVDRISINSFEQNQDSSSQSSPILDFEKTNKISLPRAVEITIGIIPQPKPVEEAEDEGLEPVFSPPIIVLLNSGMEFARYPIEKRG